MNTPAHLLIGAAAFARPAQGAALCAALLGSVLPDLSLYVMASASLYILNIPAQVVFDQLYFSPAWQTVFAVDNSFFVWGTALGLGLWRGWHLLTHRCVRRAAALGDGFLIARRRWSATILAAQFLGLRKPHQLLGQYASRHLGRAHIHGGVFGGLCGVVATRPFDRG
ncbi:hypothetical protein [Ruegeria conchae]|uniref:Uncharacterized protein n=1 Tax=Ruegeria conchae TaxID=981384 RepID=A0A497ZL54_9RHOB|nr:hypothetical protein [Ruegeria conchae]RLK10118.1 hypothetical protein CLV75_0083 [Ruegeria conchae]